MERRTVLGALWTSAALTACGGGGPAPTPAPIPLPPILRPPPSLEPIAFWGNSLTLRLGLEAAATIPNRTVFAGGVFGQTSTQAAARQGGRQSLLTVDGDTIPATGGVRVTAQTVEMQNDFGPGPITGSLAGVAGTLTRDGAGTVTFTRVAAGTAVAAPPDQPFLVDTFGRRDWTTVFWYGHNNWRDATQVKADIAWSAFFLTHERFVILGVLNDSSQPVGTADHQAIVRLNSDLASLFPDHFLDIRDFLVSKFDPTQSQDVADHANDLVPSSLRADNLHLTPAGSVLVLERVKEFLDARGW